MIDECCFSLNSCIGDFAHFLAVEFLPLLVVEILIERCNSVRVHEIDESITNVAFVLEVNGKIEEIVSSLILAVDGGEEHLLIVFVGNVLDHQSSTQVLTTAHFM